MVEFAKLQLIFGKLKLVCVAVLTSNCYNVSLLEFFSHKNGNVIRNGHWNIGTCGKAKGNSKLANENHFFQKSCCLESWREHIDWWWFWRNQSLLIQSTYRFCSHLCSHSRLLLWRSVFQCFSPFAKLALFQLKIYRYLCYTHTGFTSKCEHWWFFWPPLFLRFSALIDEKWIVLHLYGVKFNTISVFDAFGFLARFFSPLCS